MSGKPKIILLTLGEELLLGLTPNGHLTFIGDRLRKAGCALHANATLSDRADDIAKAFEYYWKRADILITTGGLGPTVDDRTKEIIAERLGEKLVYDESIMLAIEERFRFLGLAVTPNNRKQAYRFENSAAVPNPNGTAPGLWYESDGKILAMLPGPPHELQPMFEEQIIPRLSERDVLLDRDRYIQIRTTGIGESALETLLATIAAREPDLELAYCAHPGMVDFRMSLPTADNSASRLEQLALECRDLLGDSFLAYGESTLVEIVSELFRHHHLTLATAESCTGGYFSNEITNLAGSSEFFLGGLATYSETAKRTVLGVSEESIRRYGVVSSEVAMEMAAGAARKLGSDFALSATGYIGPGGGTTEHPVGTVYVGLSSPTGTTAKRFSFRGPRVVLKQQILNAAFDLLRRETLAHVANTETPADNVGHYR